MERRWNRCRLSLLLVVMWMVLLILVLVIMGCSGNGMKGLCWVRLWLCENRGNEEPCVANWYCYCAVGDNWCHKNTQLGVYKYTEVLGVMLNSFWWSKWDVKQSSEYVSANRDVKLYLCGVCEKWASAGTANHYLIHIVVRFIRISNTVNISGLGS